jgi:hypothetical protein
MLTALPPSPPAVVVMADSRLLRLRSDFGYWARNCYRILDKAGKLVPLRAQPVQRSIEAEEQKMLAEKGEARLMALKGRQGGVTTYEQAKSLHTIWANRGATTLTLAHDRDSTDKIFGITQRAIDEFDPRSCRGSDRKQRARSLSPAATLASTPAPPAPGAPAADLRSSVCTDPSSHSGTSRSLH